MGICVKEDVKRWTPLPLVVACSVMQAAAPAWLAASARFTAGRRLSDSRVVTT